MIDLVEITGPEIQPHMDGLSEMLAACVNEGAGVHFLSPLDATRARTFWDGVADDLKPHHRRMWVALDGTRVVGTVQLLLSTIENGPHRAEISKMLVHPDCRRQGLGRRLMLAAEARARDLGRTLLLLDTVTGAAGEMLYRSLGFELLGICPDFALTNDRTLGSSTFMYKRLA